jgi:protoheme ferro-lyase
MNYLIYVEHSAENLQFFLWVRDYAARFERIPESERALAPEWTQAQEEEAIARINKDASEKIRRAQPADIFRGTDFEKPALQDSLATLNDDNFSQFSSPALTPKDSNNDSMYTGTTTGSNVNIVHRIVANDAYIAAGAEKPCKIFFSHSSVSMTTSRIEKRLTKTQSQSNPSALRSTA